MLARFATELLAAHGTSDDSFTSHEPDLQAGGAARLVWHDMGNFKPSGYYTVNQEIYGWWRDCTAFNHALMANEAVGR